MNNKPENEAWWKRRSTVLPLALLVYLAVMSYIGRGELVAGNYIYYFSIIILSLACIIALHLWLKRRDRR